VKPEFFRLFRSVPFWVVVVVAASLPLWLPSYHLSIAILTLMYVGMALAWNVIGGIGGQISLAHSIFLGIGSHFAAALFLSFGVNLWIAAVLAACLAASLGMFIAWVDHRFHLGHLSFALITLAFAEIGELIVLGWDFVGGASGLNLPRDTGHLLRFEFGGAHGYFWLALVLAALCFLTNLAVLDSKLGYRLRAIRDNENAAQAVGIPLLRTKATAMAISAALMSLVGTAYARYVSFIDPYVFASPAVIIEVVLIATIGGLGTPYGPMVAAAILVPMAEIVRGELGGVAPGLHFFIYGLLIVVVIRVMPQGVVPRLSALAARRRPHARPAAPPGGQARGDAAGDPAYEERTR
jgi:branched-chain amino acid transport system permease protein